MSQTSRSWSRRLRTTNDGSPTLEVVEWGVCYHSIHGALTESLHVFVAHGLERWKEDHESSPTAAPLRVLEIGFGTGLNAALAWQWAEEQNVRLEYVGVEPFPLQEEEVNAWGASALPQDLQDRMATLHAKGFQGIQKEAFAARVVESTWQDYVPDGVFDVCFFDAFAPAQQPELWSVAVFEKVLAAMRTGGLLTTYCAKGQVRRNLEAAGWKVERHPGPPGKREMLVGQHVPVSRWNVRCYALILNPARTHVLVARERFPTDQLVANFREAASNRGVSHRCPLAGVPRRAGKHGRAELAGARLYQRFLCGVLSAMTNRSSRCTIGCRPITKASRGGTKNRKRSLLRNLFWK